MTALGAFGYAAVGVSYAFLTVLLLTTWRGQRIAVFLILACLISTLWAFGLAAQTGYDNISPLVVALLEVARATAWTLFLVRLVSGMGVSRRLGWLAIAICTGIAAAMVYLALRGPAQPGGAVNLGQVLIPGGLVIALFGLVLIEQLYRNASGESRWSLKPMVFAVGGLFAYDLFLYSQGMLLSAIDSTTWMARGAVNLLFVPMIAIAVRRNTDWQVRIFVSRQVVFYSTTLIAAGLYLLVMSFVGFLIVRYGGSWGALARIVFLVGAILVLVSLLFSSTLRARLKVFLNKHFFHNKYDYREEWMRLVSTLADFDISSAGDIAIKAMAQIVDSPVGAMWTREGNTFVLSARYNTDDDFPDLPADEAIVRFVESEHWLIDFVEYVKEPERYRNLALPKWLEARTAAWMLVPLQAGGKLLGLILLYKSPNVPALNYEDRDLLKTVGNHIAVHLAQARADAMLAEAQQFEAYNRLTAFLMHDLNNLIAQQSLIVTNAEKHKRNPEFVDDAIRTIAGSVDRMKRIMSSLKSRVAESASKSTDLKFIVSTAVDRCAVRRPVPSLELNGVDARLAVNAEELTMVLTHLIRNAQDACESSGEVAVSLEQGDDAVSIVVRDSGVGMSSDFVRNRLFRPFDSTKGAQGMGIGAYQAREFARKLGGDLKVDSVVGEGTRVSMSIPFRDPV